MKNSSLMAFLVLVNLVFISGITFATTTTVYSSFATNAVQYSNYLMDTTDKSVELTRQYQDEIGLWNQGKCTNDTMAKITDSFLPRFVNQLNEFNNTQAPEEYGIVKENFVKSFASEIKSYELFKEYLTTNNSTKNDLSTDYLSDALRYETVARDAFARLNNGTQ
jgi:hypothetical protein